LKIYKYRALSAGDERGIGRVARIVRNRAVWCAAPESLNDCKEFSWACDFTASPHTSDLLADLLVRLKGWQVELARQASRDAIGQNRLRTVAEPVIDEMIRKSRDEIGVASFGSSADNLALWKRYAGDGAGVCIELEIPDSALGRRFHRVVYEDSRVIHVDDFLRSRFDRRYAAVVYATLLTKTTVWAPEEEIRFLSKRQRVEVVIEDSAVTQVTVGQHVAPSDVERIREIAGSIPVVGLPVGRPSRL
jgi:hypothetical protein